MKDASPSQTSPGLQIHRAIFRLHSHQHVPLNTYTVFTSKPLSLCPRFPRFVCSHTSSHVIQTSQEPRCHSRYLTFLNLFYTRSDPIVSFALSVFPEPLHLSVSPSPSDFLIITSVSVASSCDQSCFSLYCQSDRLKAQIC